MPAALMALFPIVIASLFSEGEIPVGGCCGPGSTPAPYLPIVSFQRADEQAANPCFSALTGGAAVL